jgi:uncharacterized protein
MVTHRYSETSDYDNPTVFCADQTMLIERVHEHVGRHAMAGAA